MASHMVLDKYLLSVQVGTWMDQRANRWARPCSALSQARAPGSSVAPRGPLLTSSGGDQQGRTGWLHVGRDAEPGLNLGPHHQLHS